jgi:hypothetical protein
MTSPVEKDAAEKAASAKTADPERDRRAKSKKEIWRDHARAPGHRLGQAEPPSTVRAHFVMIYKSK